MPLVKKKHSLYSDTNTKTPSDKKILLGSLFGYAGPSSTEVQAVAEKYFAAEVAEGDPQYFPAVHLDYQGFENGYGPDVSQVKWTQPGDPSTPYTPDLRSPGNPQLIPQQNAPVAAAIPSDVKEMSDQAIATTKVLPAPGRLTNGEANPITTGKAIHDDAAAGVTFGVSLPAAMK